MKNILFVFLIISLLASCKSKTNATYNDSTSQKDIPLLDKINESRELIKKFKPIIQGVWVKADYVNKVIKTKSPLAASDLATGLTTIYINSEEIKGDSIVSMGGYYNHDGANTVIKFKSGKKPGTILFNDSDLSYRIEDGDTILNLRQYDEKKKQFIKADYIRIFKREPNNDLADGMYYYINRFLVAGNYTLKDNTGVTSNIYFSEDGKVNGFLNCKTYVINIDLNSDVNDNLDGIYFKAADKKNYNYTFKIIADTLNLYDTYENADSTELILGKLKYKLVRSK